ncbi:hypothetical protein BJ508DRAFT_245225 [Ascobolus immersus RN42]|uniref:BTB domain-containing protein n=1 Tax=Ascobolus immersus RN42 TaxID=1160509 RepID=A0A3N4HBG5_ASCIM|nr:hypothetical protein BJ508DRAFT_245225 [Ascobolus immersus RN42]
MSRNNRVAKAASWAKPFQFCPAVADAILAAARRRETREDPAESITAGNLSLLRSGKYSDLTLKCKGEEFKVHCSILCPQSEFFAACVESGMKESASKVIELVDEDPSDVKRMLEFLYVRRYWEHPQQAPENPDDYDNASERLYEEYEEMEGPRSEEDRLRDPVMVNMRMYALADKFGIPALKKQARKGLRRFSSLTFESLTGRDSKGAANANSSEGRADLIVEQWQRLVDAAMSLEDFIDDEKLMRVLVDPVARVAPQLSESHKTQFKDLIQRLTEKGSNELSVRMFEKACLESQWIRRATLERWKEDKEKHKSQLETLVRRMKGLLNLVVEHKRFSHDNCRSNRVPLPVYCEVSNTVRFKCQGCGVYVVFPPYDEESESSSSDSD